MTTNEIPFVDLPKDSFPVHMTAFSQKTQEVLWEETVSGPGALRIPGRPEHLDDDDRVMLRVVFANGMVIES